MGFRQLERALDVKRLVGPAGLWWHTSPISASRALRPLRSVGVRALGRRCLKAQWLRLWSRNREICPGDPMGVSVCQQIGKANADAVYYLGPMTVIAGATVSPVRS
jgi:hypothetical protein